MQQSPEQKSPEQTQTVHNNKQLLDSIRRLKQILDQVIQNEATPKVAEIVEQLQGQYVTLQTDNSPAKRQQFLDNLEDLPADTLNDVIRVFSLYFSLLHIAEEATNLRQRRQEIARNKHFWKDSFHDTLLGFQQAGVTINDLKILLSDLQYMPVMTAHPTEAKRRTLRGTLRNIFLSYEKIDDSQVTGFYHQRALNRLKAQIQLLWKTDEVRAHSMGVIDEIESGLFYFPLSLFESTAQVYRNFELALNDVYGDQASREIKIPSFLTYGSWIGGDRDGNPNVTPETTVLALRLQKSTVLNEYIRRVTALQEQLAYSHGLCQPTKQFLDSLESDRQLLGENAINLERGSTQEPYRHKLAFIKYRLEQSLIQVKQQINGSTTLYNAHLYPGAAQFYADLMLIKQSLISHGDQAIADMELQDLIRLVETFGFHLMQLDVRQESTHHSEAVADILSAAIGLDYNPLNESQRLEVLGQAISSSNGLIYNPSQLKETTRNTLDVFRVMTDMRREIGEDCFSRYVISMTHTASHVMEVLLLAAQSGLVGCIGGHWYCHIGVSPLFETIEDLAHIDSVLRNLLEQPIYLKLLEASGQRQEVMLGYSDSCKDGGILSSAWNLYRSQQEVMAIADAENIDCRIFHGRGGTIGRGGGPTHQAILAQPPATVRGQIKFTEQGEVLFYRYNNQETAVYELTLGVTGLLKASLSLVRPVAEDKPEDMAILSELAAIGEQDYRHLTEKTAGFLDYFYEATPVSEISQLNIGSRPSHRNKQDRSKQSVRAIGWVFAWAQSRQTFPAWYGIGSSLETWCKDNPERLQTLRTLYRNCPFFHNLISNTQMALRKSDINIAREYTALCIDKDMSERIHTMIFDEYHRCVDNILEITQADHLLAENPELAASLHHRNEYLGPLNYIQANLLRKVRSDTQANEEPNQWTSPLLRTINAIAAGMRNTG